VILVADLVGADAAGQLEAVDVNFGTVDATSPGLRFFETPLCR
jgi:hypothetical protein